MKVNLEDESVVIEAITAYLDSMLARAALRVGGVTPTGSGFEIELLVVSDKEAEQPRRELAPKLRPRRGGTSNGISDEQVARIKEGIMAGQSNKEIAQEIALPVSTVGFHGTRIRKELRRQGPDGFLRSGEEQDV